MTNNQLKNKIEKAAGAELHWWIRQDSPQWFEGGITCGEFSFDMWSNHENRKAAYRHLLEALVAKIEEHAGTKDMTNMQKQAIATARKVAVTMSTDAFPIEIVAEKVEFTSMGDIWFTMDTKNANAAPHTYLDFVDSVHWFMNITRRGKVTIHQGPHWAKKGTNGMHAAKDGYFGA
ncbi:MAG: hypothetical protein OEQ39_00045 [Gammaproteobacteria bacterium]|nr:hypothetical protein [Gammaproteobacteria bacterium]